MDFGQQITCTVPKFGDLLGACFLVIDFPRLFLQDGTEVPYTNSMGQALIEEIKLMIGETEIDKQNGMWLNIWGALTTPADQQFGYQDMVGQVDGNPTVTIPGP